MGQGLTLSPRPMATRQAVGRSRTEQKNSKGFPTISLYVIDSAGGIVNLQFFRNADLLGLGEQLRQEEQTVLFFDLLNIYIAQSIL